MAVSGLAKKFQEKKQWLGLREKKKDSEKKRLAQEVVEEPEVYGEDETVIADFTPAELYGNMAEPEIESDPSASNGFMGQLRKGLSKTRDFLNTDVEDLFRSNKSIDEMLEEIESDLE